MEKNIEQKINLYSQIYEQISKRIPQLSPENTGEIAGRIFGELAEDLRVDLASQPRTEENQATEEEETEEQPATEKQRAALHRFGIRTIPEYLSKQRASEIMEKLINLSEERNREEINKMVEELNRKWRKE